MASAPKILYAFWTQILKPKIQQRDRLRVNLAVLADRLLTQLQLDSLQPVEFQALLGNGWFDSLPIWLRGSDVTRLSMFSGLQPAGVRSEAKKFRCAGPTSLI